MITDNSHIPPYHAPCGVATPHKTHIPGNSPGPGAPPNVSLQTRLLTPWLPTWPHLSPPLSPLPITRITD